MISQSAYQRLLRWRAKLVPDELQQGWVPFYNLGYLIFLFLPLFFRSAGRENAFGYLPGMVLPTLLTVAVFLYLYFRAYRGSTRVVFTSMLGVAALGYLLLPVNAFANTYAIYAIGLAASIGGSLLWKFAWAMAILLGLFAGVVFLNYPAFMLAITSIIAISVFFGNYFFIEKARKSAELKLSHEEVRRLAALAERERIGRDLHDLLGHTLSLIALKSELAGKLLDRDLLAARREIDEVTKVARDSLSQVRRAVTGIRAAGLGAELASAKLLLESAGVGFRYTLAEEPLPPEVETVLALCVREAVTNIHRHAHASLASVEFSVANSLVSLHIKDDGRGSAFVPGNGLIGMRERIEALGGRLRIDSKSGQGTHLLAELPIWSSSSASISVRTDISVS